MTLHLGPTSVSFDIRFVIYCRAQKNEKELERKWTTTSFISWTINSFYRFFGFFGPFFYLYFWGPKNLSKEYNKEAVVNEKDVVKKQVLVSFFYNFFGPDVSVFMLGPKEIEKETLVSWSIFYLGSNRRFDFLWLEI